MCPEPLLAPMLAGTKSEVLAFSDMDGEVPCLANGWGSTFRAAGGPALPDVAETADPAGCSASAALFPASIEIGAEGAPRPAEAGGATVALVPFPATRCLKSAGRAATKFQPDAVGGLVHAGPLDAGAGLDQGDAGIEAADA